MLPLYVDVHKSKKDKNCLKVLNKGLVKKEGFTIHTKDPEYYRTCSKGYRNQKTLLKSYQYNHSFESFIKELQARNITIAPEEDW